MKALATAAFLCLITATQGGCLVAAAVGAAALVFSDGDLVANVGANLEEVAEATKAAFDELDVTLTEEEASGPDVVIKGKGPDGVVRVEAKPDAAGGSQISIHVGAMGDKKKSGLILAKIEEFLPPDKGVIKSEKAD
jgi:hypothetical protein